MKKILITLTIMLAAAALIAAFSGPASAAVSGRCDICHTMHNSQGGSAMAEDELGTKMATPYAHLTMSSCVGCHFKATTIDAPKIDGAYNVDSTAGGTFLESGVAGQYVASDAGVHNVLEGLATSTLGEDDTFSGAGDIPGLSTGMNANKGSNDPHELTCAGSNGCHGDATVTTGNDAGIRGFHHGSKSGWRYLQIAGDQGAVLGKGASDWEKAISGGAVTTPHNVYSSDPSDGINKLCANCHPDFHGAGVSSNTQDANGNWIRHPTDYDIPSGWSAVVDYRDNPFAFADLTGKTATGTYDDTSAQVACISCHRAHGTPYDDILRWDYADQAAGGGYVAGCLGCHTLQQ